MRVARALVCCSFLLATAACSSFRLDPNGPVTPDEFRQHVLMFDARGEPRDPLGAHASLIAEDTPSGGGQGPTFDAYIENILAGIKAHRDKYGSARIIFFFHGGLNSRSAALQRAQEQIAAMKEPVEKGGRPDLYPIFVNWQTSLYASYKDHLLFVTKGQDTYRDGVFLAPFKFASDVSRAVFEIVPDNHLAIRDLARHLTYVREGATQASGCALTQLDFREGTTRERSFANRFTDKLGAFTTYLLTKWWMTGVIDGGGTPAWSSMIYTSDRLFFSDQEMHHSYAFRDREPSGAGDFSHFLRALASQPKGLQQGDEIILAAHSAGAIVANAMLQHFGEVLPITTLVYMAPACTIDELMTGGRVANFLAGGKPGTPRRQLYLLTLHEVSELSERHFIDLTPRGSLLVWLDQYIQPKNSEFRGHMMGRARNLRLHAHLIPCAIQPQIHITAFSEQPQFAAGAGPAYPEPQTHGSFGAVPYWRGKEVWQPVSADLRLICFSDDPKKSRDPEKQGHAGAGSSPPCIGKP
ncbi:MAG TPA: hypothetical protein VN605_14945 [Thermoanaerobaculia bacterium]|nr:hypothetical protein [Thermoanaerobaculia bacterium]